MGWGPEPIWTTAQVMDCEPASSNSVSVKVQVPDDVMEGFGNPGQYVQLKESEDGKPLFLAIASPPPSPEDEGNVLEFLIKKTDSNGWITDPSSAIKSVITSQVMGKGFAVKENFDGFKYDFPTQNVILCATGSGIAPIRSAIESGVLGIGGGRTARLYYGCRTLEQMAYKDRFGSWEEAGVEVVPILSQPEISPLEWQGRTGYVQTALEEDGIPIPRNSGALLCGVKGMTQAVTDLLTKAGVFDGRILMNF